jgi:hypothetical protein
MKDLRRSLFALQQSPRTAALLEALQRIGDGCVAMNTGYPPCGATIVERLSFDENASF